MSRVLHASLFVDDIEASIAFYTQRLGLLLLDGPHEYPGNAKMAFVGTTSTPSRTEGAALRETRHDGWDAYLELVEDLEAHAPYSSVARLEHVALEVDDLDATLTRLRDAGVAVTRGPLHAPDGVQRIAFTADPDGIAVELVERTT